MRLIACLLFLFLALLEKNVVFDLYNLLRLEITFDMRLFIINKIV